MAVPVYIRLKNPMMPHRSSDGEQIVGMHLVRCTQTLQKYFTSSRIEQMQQVLYECQEILREIAAQIALAIDYAKLFPIVDGRSQVRPSAIEPKSFRCAFGHRVGKICLDENQQAACTLAHRERQLTNNQGAKFPGPGQMGNSQLEDLHIYLGLPTRVRHLI
jgi:hypothetical protein